MSRARIAFATAGVAVFSGLLAVSAYREPYASAAPAAASDATKFTPASYRLVDIEAIKGLLHQGRGHVLLVHFWASWCGPCMRELPMMDKFAHDMKPRGLEVMSISLDNPGRSGVAEHVGALLRERAPNLTPNIAKFVLRRFSDVTKKGKVVMIRDRYCTQTFLPAGENQFLGIRFPFPVCNRVSTAPSDISGSVDL